MQFWGHSGPPTSWNSLVDGLLEHSCLGLSSKLLLAQNRALAGQF